MREHAALQDRLGERKRAWRSGVQLEADHAMLNVKQAEARGGMPEWKEIARLVADVILRRADGRRSERLAAFERRLLFPVIGRLLVISAMRVRGLCRRRLRRDPNCERAVVRNRKPRRGGNARHGDAREAGKPPDHRCFVAAECEMFKQAVRRAGGVRSR